MELSNAAYHFDSVIIKIIDACTAFAHGDSSFITSAKAQRFLALAEIKNYSVH